MIIATSPFVNASKTNRVRAFRLGFGLGFLASFKTIAKLAKPTGFAETKMWYGISNDWVFNKPTLSTE
jgi:hypothetical protein